jgi:two-component sensor histidine kinase
LLEHSRVTGAVLLMRDVSELRRRDRLLLTKDATIREIHHRVKNNLQTISSLLRLHARRLASPEARDVIEESVRRIRSIALVHETLSAGSSQELAFSEIVRPLVRMVEEGLLSAERSVRFVVEGDAGELRAEVATPLAVALTELLQNALEHGFPYDGDGHQRPGEVVISLRNDGQELTVRVSDNGVGLPDGFSLDHVSSLGLTIVKALVTSELGGTISMHTDGGTVVELHLPVGPDRETAAVSASA